MLIEVRDNELLREVNLGRNSASTIVYLLIIYITLLTLRCSAEQAIILYAPGLSGFRNLGIHCCQNQAEARLQRILRAALPVLFK